GVDKDAVVAGEKRECERETSAVALEATDHVRALVAIENTGEHIGAVHDRFAECVLRRARDRVADASRVTGGIGEPVPDVAEQSTRELFRSTIATTPASRRVLGARGELGP